MTGYRQYDFRELSSHDPDLSALGDFYAKVYTPEFPDPDERETLQNMERYLRLKTDGWYGANNYHIILGFDGGNCFAGSVADFLSVPNAGVLEFLVIDSTARGQGGGKRLLAETEALLASDAKGAGGIDCIVAEMNDPFKTDIGADSVDPFVRAAVWDRWGYKRLDFPYVQPALSGEQGAVRNLLLMAKAFRPEFEQAIPADKVKSILREYMRWAMRIDAPEKSPVYQDMLRHLDRVDAVPMTSLCSYVGRDPARPLELREIADIGNPDFAAAMAVYESNFRDSIAVAAEAFGDLIKRKRPTPPYHFWAIRAAASAPVEGMASFFTFPTGGFGGYVAMQGSLKGTKRFPLLLARIEEQMIRDRLGARGWYIECEPPQEAIFAHMGFATVDCIYRQPPLSQGAYELHAAPQLRLMYKDFGANFQPAEIGLDVFLGAIEDIHRAVYKIETPRASPYFADIRRQTADWTGNIVRFRGP